MAILFMLSWWYSSGWAWALERLGTEVRHIGNVFAVKILLKTWAAPWKQITSTSAHQTFFQRLADNTISRLVGFVIRTCILFAAFIWATLVAVSGCALIVLWPLLPLLVVILPVLYLQGVTL